MLKKLKSRSTAAVDKKMNKSLGNLTTKQSILKRITGLECCSSQKHV